MTHEMTIETSGDQLAEAQMMSAWFSKFINDPEYPPQPLPSITIERLIDHFGDGDPQKHLRLATDIMRTFEPIAQTPIAMYLCGFPEDMLKILIDEDIDDVRSKIGIHRVLPGKAQTTHEPIGDIEDGPSTRNDLEVVGEGYEHGEDDIEDDVDDETKKPPKAPRKKLGKKAVKASESKSMADTSSQSGPTFESRLQEIIGSIGGKRTETLESVVNYILDRSRGRKPALPEQLPNTSLERIDYHFGTNEIASSLDRIATKLTMKDDSIRSGVMLYFGGVDMEVIKKILGDEYGRVMHFIQTEFKKPSHKKKMRVSHVRTEDPTRPSTSESASSATDTSTEQPSQSPSQASADPSKANDEEAYSATQPYHDQVGVLKILGINKGEIGWQDLAPCSQTDPEAFFPEKGENNRFAKQVCLKCEVRLECLNYALDHDEQFGIWGGMSERERRKIKYRKMNESDNSSEDDQES